MFGIVILKRSRYMELLKKERILASTTSIAEERAAILEIELNQLRNKHKEELNSIYGVTVTNFIHR